jgi:hypothetical protein
VAFAVSKAARSHRDVQATVDLWRATLDAVYEMYRPEATRPPVALAST